MMEDKDLIFNLIDTLSYPILVLEESDTKTFVPHYQNQKMDTLLNNTGEQSNEKDKKLESFLPTLLNSYQEKEQNAPFSLQDIELFENVYTVHFNKNGKYLLIIFIEVPSNELLSAMTFHKLSGACSALMIILDDMGNIVDSNECFCKFVGVSREASLGKAFFETFIPGDLEKLNHYFEKIFTADVYHQQFVTPLKNAQGEISRINWQVSKIVRQSKNYIIAVGSDISKVVEENNNLKRQLTSIKVGFDYFPFAVAYMNGEGEFTKLNSRFTEMFGIPKSNQKLHFKQIKIFNDQIGFEKMNEQIELIKELSYTLHDTHENKLRKLQVNIRLLSGKKTASKFYIFVAQNIK